MWERLWECVCLGRTLTELSYFWYFPSISLWLFNFILQRLFSDHVVPREIAATSSFPVTLSAITPTPKFTCALFERRRAGSWLLFVQNVVLKKEQVVRRQLFPEFLSKWNISTLIESHYVQSDPALFVDVCLYADANEITDRGKKEICTGFMTAQKYFRAFLWEGEGTGGKRNGKWQIARMLIAFRSSLRQQSRPPTPNFSIQTKLKHFPGAVAFS